MPTVVTATIGSGGDYASPGAWWSAVSSIDVVANDEIRAGILIDDDVTYTQGTISGGTSSDATRYYALMSASGIRAKLTPGRVLQHHFRFFNIDIVNDDVLLERDVWYINCLIRDPLDSGTEGLFKRGTSGSPTLVNCQVIGSGATAGARPLGIDFGGNGTCRAFNCLVTNINGTGISWTVGSLKEVTNCIVVDCSTADIAAGGTITTTATSDTSGTIDSIDPDVEFADYAGDDFRLAAGSSLIAAGTDLSSTFTESYEYDHAAETGPLHGDADAGGAWNVGPYDGFVSAGPEEAVVGVGVVPVPRLVRGAASVAGVAAQPTPSLVRGAAPVQAVAETPAPSLRRAVAPLSVVAELPTSTLRRAVSSVAGVGVQTAPSLLRKVASVTGVGQVPLTEPSGSALHRINCGGAEHTDGDSNVWDADRDFSTPSNTFSTGDPIAGTPEDALYQSERSTGASGGTHAVTYTLDVPAATPVLVRFHLAEVWHTVAGQRLFSIEIDGVTKVAELDLVAVAGHDVAYVLEFPVTTTGTTLEATVRNGTEDRAKLNALEVLVDDGATPSVDGVGELPPPSLVRGVAPVVGVGQLPAPSRVSSVPPVTGVGVVPDPTPPTDLEYSGGVNQQISSAVGVDPGSFSIFVENPFDYAVRWEAHPGADWIELSESFGRLLPGQSKVITAQPRAAGLAAGEYHAWVSVVAVDRSDREPHSVAVRYVVGTPPAVTGTVYYVDYETGDDSNDGESTGAPFKYHPWDVSATGTSNATTLIPGDKVVLKGGIHRAKINYEDSGNASDRIVLDGNTDRSWGTGPAIISGADPLSGWVQNGSEYTADVSAFSDLHPHVLNLYDGDRPMQVAQWPTKQDDAYVWDDLSNWQSLSGITYTATSITWPAGFGALAAGFHVPAYIAGWTDDNRISVVKVTGYDSGTGTLTFGSMNWIASQTPRFILLNSPAFLTDAGEYWVDETAQEVTILPFSGSDLSDVQASERTYGFSMGAQDYVDLRGLVIEKYAGEAFGTGSAVISLGTGGCEHNRIDACQARHNRSLGQNGAFNLRNSTEIHVSGCVIAHNRESRGIHMTNGSGGTGATDYTFRQSLLFANGGTQFYTSDSDGVVIEDVTAARHVGTHSNGGSVYEGSVGTRVRRLRMLEGNFALTIQPKSSGGDIEITSCVLDMHPDASGPTFAVWTGENAVNVRMYHNTILNPNGQAFSNLGGFAAGFELVNNIIDGIAVGSDTAAVRSHNIYTSSWDGSVAIGGTEQLVLDKSSIFVDLASGDYRLKAGSPAIDTGTDIGDPDLDYITPVGPYDIGAFEYSESDYVAPVVGVGVLPVPKLVRGVAPVVGVGVVPESTDQVPSVTGVGQVPIPRLVRKVDPLSAVGELPAPTLVRAAAPVVGVPVLPPAARISHPPAVVGVGQVPLTVEQPFEPAVGVGVVPVPRLIRKVAPLVAVGVVPETNELLMEPVPEYVIARAGRARAHAGLRVDPLLPGGRWVQDDPRARVPRHRLRGRGQHPALPRLGDGVAPPDQGCRHASEGRRDGVRALQGRAARALPRRPDRLERPVRSLEAGDGGGLWLGTSDSSPSRSTATSSA